MTSQHVCSSVEVDAIDLEHVVKALRAAAAAIVQANDQLVGYVDRVDEADLRAVDRLGEAVGLVPGWL